MTTPHERLTSLLYVLMRDDVPAGAVERAVQDHVEKMAGREPVFSNPHLAAYARELADRVLAEPHPAGSPGPAPARG